MMTKRQLALLLFTLVFVTVAVAFLLMTSGPRATQDSTASARPTPPAWSTTASTPAPDPDIQKDLREAHKLKVYPPNHPEGIEP